MKNTKEYSKIVKFGRWLIVVLHPKVLASPQTLEETMKGLKILEFKGDRNLPIVVELPTTNIDSYFDGGPCGKSTSIMAATCWNMSGWEIFTPWIAFRDQDGRVRIIPNLKLRDIWNENHFRIELPQLAKNITPKDAKIRKFAHQ